MGDIKTRKCGCIVYDVGPPVLCEAHQAKVERRAQRDKVKEEKGLRKLVTEQAAALGHELTRFKEYGAAGQPGKYTAHCTRCGDIVIVYDDIKNAPADQVIGKPLTEGCRRSDTFAALQEMSRRSTDDGPTDDKLADPEDREPAGGADPVHEED